MMKIYILNIILLIILSIIKVLDIILTIIGLNIENVIESNLLGFNIFSILLYLGLMPIIFIGIYLSRNIKIGLIGFIIIIGFSIIIGIYVLINNITIIKEFSNNI